MNNFLETGSLIQLEGHSEGCCRSWKMVVSENYIFVDFLLLEGGSTTDMRNFFIFVDFFG